MGCQLIAGHNRTHTDNLVMPVSLRRVALGSGGGNCLPGGNPRSKLNRTPNPHFWKCVKSLSTRVNLTLTVAVELNTVHWNKFLCLYVTTGEGLARCCHRCLDAAYLSGWRMNLQSQPRSRSHNPRSGAITARALSEFRMWESPPLPNSGNNLLA